jgi:hypothetical protein
MFLQFKKTYNTMYNVHYTLKMFQFLCYKELIALSPSNDKIHHLNLIIAIETIVICRTCFLSYFTILMVVFSCYCVLLRKLKHNNK